MFNKLLYKIRGLTDTLLGASLGALVYAIWAAFVNFPFGAFFALKVASTHWVLSTLITFYSTAVMRFSFRLPPTFSIKQIRGILTFVSGMILTYGILVPAHLILGTPDIFLTLSAGIIPTTVFCVSYALLLNRTEIIAA